MKIIKSGLYLVLFVLVSFGLFYQFWFLRNPERKTPATEKALISPANGTVVSINRVNSGMANVPKNAIGYVSTWLSEIDTACTIVSIQMTPMHVHYQKAPVNGKLLKSNYVAGKFENAIVMNNDWGIRFENEHNEWLFEDEYQQKIKVIQISGFVARRIVDFIKPGQQITKGEVIGLIKLGSQVTVVLPSSYQVTVSKGETVTDGETILAKLVN